LFINQSPISHTPDTSEAISIFLVDELEPDLGNATTRTMATIYANSLYQTVRGLALYDPHLYPSTLDVGDVGILVSGRWIRIFNPGTNTTNTTGGFLQPNPPATVKTKTTTTSPDASVYCGGAFKLKR
jgi:hypothetical protein